MWLNLIFFFSSDVLKEIWYSHKQYDLPWSHRPCILVHWAWINQGGQSSTIVYLSGLGTLGTSKYHYILWHLGTGSSPGWCPGERAHPRQRQWMRGPWQGSLPVQKDFLLDNLFPFFCFNLSLDQAGSPLIISVIPLPNPGQQICFSKVSGPEINWKKKKGKSSTSHAAGQSAGWKQPPIVFTFLWGP